MLARNEEPHDATTPFERPRPMESLKHAAMYALWFAPVVLAVIVLRYAVAAM